VLYFIRLLLRPIVTTLLSPPHRHCLHATSTLLTCFIDSAYMLHRHCLHATSTLLTRHIDTAQHTIRSWLRTQTLPFFHRRQS